jgi:hypothetical protein
MKEEMKELHTEGLATHGDPEPCGGVREDAAEALAGVRAGGLLSLERVMKRGADAVALAEGKHLRRRFRESTRGAAGSENLCMHGTFMRENREIPASPVSRSRGGRAAQGRLRPQA